MSRIVLFLSTFLWMGQLSAQEWRLGYTFGIAFSVGSETNRLGLSAACYGNYEWAQVNVSTRAWYQFKSIGLHRKTPEIQLGAGLKLGFGPDREWENGFIGIAESNLPNTYSAGYAFTQYWDRQGTTQTTGTISFNAFQFYLLTENDLFGNWFNQTDQYRTAAFRIGYQYLDTRVGLNLLIWTHDYASCEVINNTEVNEWARFGYYQDPDVKERRESHGSVSLQVNHVFVFHQNAQVNIGIAGERIRNAFQNDLIHDQPFFFEGMIRRKPPHIPMITPDGKQYISGEKPKGIKTKGYYMIGLNLPRFY